MPDIDRYGQNPVESIKLVNRLSLLVKKMAYEEQRDAMETMTVKVWWSSTLKSRFLISGTRWTFMKDVAI